MEEIEEIDQHILQLSNIKIEDMFPVDIYYPKQEKILENSFNANNFYSINDSSLIMPNENKMNNFQNSSSFTSIEESKPQKQFTNFKCLNIKMSENPYQTHRTTNPRNSLNLQNQISKQNGRNFTHKTEKNPVKSLYPKVSKEIVFSTEGDQVYDIFLQDDILVACGGKFIKVYNFEKIRNSGKNEDGAAMIFSDKEEDFYTLSYSYISSCDFTEYAEFTPRHVLAAGGKKSIIRLLDLKDGIEFSQLIGHRNEIYDLKFHPCKKYSYLLLSASKDFSIRLWNVINCLQICIFGGPDGHSADVISIDWHISGDYFVSSGVDNFIKIWEIDESIRDKINLSKSIRSRKEKREKSFRTKIKTKSIFSCNSLHENYVDCVKFNGNFVISKSVDGIMKEWQPIFNKEGDYYFLINTYVYPLNEKIWYLKFGLDQIHKKIIGVGNTKGEIYFFNLNENCNDSEDDISNDFDYFFSKNPSAKLNTQNEAVIRSMSFDSVSNFFAIGNNCGEIYVGNIQSV